MPDTIDLRPETWVKAYAEYLYSFAIKRINDPELCKDLVQETFISALKSRNGFNGNSSERTWLTSILRNKIIDSYRQKKLNVPTEILAREKNADNLFEPNGHWKESTSPQVWPEEDTDPLRAKEFQSILNRCLKKLPSGWALAFSMKYLEDEDSENICKELNLTSTNYWVMIHRAKVSLRACLEKNWLKV